MEAQKLLTQIENLRHQRLQLESYIAERPPALPQFWLNQSVKLVTRVGERVLLLKIIPRLRGFRVSKLVDYWSREAQLTRSQATTGLKVAEQKLFESRFELAARSSALEPKPKTKVTEEMRAGFSRSRAERFQRLDQLSEQIQNQEQVFKGARTKLSRWASQKRAHMKLDEWIKEFEAALKDEDLSLSLIESLRPNPTRTSEELVHFFEPLFERFSALFERREFAGYRANYAKAKNWLPQEFVELENLTHSRALKSLNSLNAIEIRLRHFYELEGRSISARQAARIRKTTEHISKLKSKILDWQTQQNAKGLSSKLSEDFSTYIAETKARGFPSSQKSISLKSVNRSPSELVTRSELPPVLQKLDGPWRKLKIDSTELEVYVRFSNHGGSELFVGRKILNEWRVLDRQFVTD